jgi:hypothetical protein
MFGLFIDLLIIFLLPIIFLFALVGSINWLLDKIFGYDPLAPYQAGFHQTIQAEFIQKASSFSTRKEREAKYTPHYDALVDAEWDKSRLEETANDGDWEEIHSLGDLLEQKYKE